MSTNNDVEIIKQIDVENYMRMSEDKERESEDESSTKYFLKYMYIFISVIDKQNNEKTEIKKEF